MEKKTTTTTMETLFVEIFDRKRHIIDQVKHQAKLFEQHLASTLLIDGIPQPPWLLPQPHPTELKKEELISGLLFPFPQAPAPYSISRNSLYDQPIFTADGEQHRVFNRDACTLHGSPEVRGETSVLPDVVGTHGCSSSGAPSLAFSHPAKSRGECAVNDAPEPTPTPVPKSPREQREASVPDSYHSLGQSLAMVQRSKSRQKNIELRNSVKASKSSLRDECHAAVEPSRVVGSGDARSLIDHMDAMELVGPTSNDCSIHIMEEPQLVDCWSGSMGCMTASDRSTEPIASGLQPLCVDESVKCGSSEIYGAQVLDSSLKSNNRALEVVESPSIRSIIEDSRGKQKNSSNHCASISRSQCSTRPYCEDELLNLADSCLFGRDATILTEEVSHVDTDGKLEESSRKQEPEVEFCQPDRSVQIEPKQIDFDDAAEFESGLNRIACTASEERVQDVSAPGLSNSLDLGTGDRENSHLFSTEPCVEETGEGSRITRQDAAVHAKEALQGGTCPNSDFSLERETSKGRFSVLVSKAILPSDGPEDSNMSIHPELILGDCAAEVHFSDMITDNSVSQSADSSSGLQDVGCSELDYHNIAGDAVLSEHKSRLHSGSSRPQSRPRSVRNGQAENPTSSATWKKASLDSSHRNSEVSNLSRVECQQEDAPSPDNTTRAHDGNAVHSNASCYPVNLDEPSLDDYAIERFQSSPMQQDREVIPCSVREARSVRNRQAEHPTSSATWKKATLESSHRNSEVRNLSRVECHQEDAPCPDQTITARNGNAVQSNASCYPVNLDEPSLDDYAIERFQSSPMERDREGDSGPSLDVGAFTQNAADPRLSLSGNTEMTGRSGDVIDPRMCTIDENKDPEHAEDESESGDGERSASSEGPIEGTSCHQGESSKLSHLVDSHLPPTRITDVDQTMPVLEGFFMQSGDEDSCLSKGGYSSEKFDLQDTIVERASFMERLCKSTSLHTPSTQLSTAGPLHRGSNSYQSVPNGLLEYIDLKSTQPLEDDIIGLFQGGFFKKDIGHALDGKSFSDCLPVSDAENSWKPYASPVGKFWEKITSNSGSSKKKASLIPELPCISEENEISDEATGTSAKKIPLAVMTGSVKTKALAAITEDNNCPASVSELENGRYSLESVNTEFSFSGTNKRPKQKLGTHKRSKKRHTSKMRDSKAIPRGVRNTKLPMETLRNSVSQAKTSLQRDGLGTSRKEAKRGNIVSNMTSFVPLVQQKQAAVALTGKRDVKVKALEAAVVARRQAEKREVERKMKKEALKLERARMEQENIRQLELEKKKKEEEKKKKEAEIATRKRLREEEERREKERKRKRVEDARKHQEEQKDKLCSKKDEKQTRKKAKIRDEKKDANVKALSENEGAKGQGSQTVPEDGSLVPETPHNCLDNLKVTSFFNQGKVKSFKEDENKKQSYDISPYQCSDDEDEDGDEDEDDNAPRKFIPSWTSKNHIALAISSQNSVDPNLIFPRDSFCSIDEVVLPRKLRLK